MNEAEPKGKLVKFLKVNLPGLVILRHEDHFTAGIPDISISARGRTVWLEIKIERKGKIKGKGIQEVTMKKLARDEGTAWYVIYAEDKSLTWIVAPDELDLWSEGNDYVPAFKGWAHEKVLDLVRSVFLCRS